MMFVGWLSVQRGLHDSKQFRRGRNRQMTVYDGVCVCVSDSAVRCAHWVQSEWVQLSSDAASTCHHTHLAYLLACRVLVVSMCWWLCLNSTVTLTYLLVIYWWHVCVGTLVGFDSWLCLCSCKHNSCRTQKADVFWTDFLCHMDQFYCHVVTDQIHKIDPVQGWPKQLGKSRVLNIFLQFFLGFCNFW